jgi:hypothetical protein
MISRDRSASAASEMVGRWTPSIRARVSWVISSLCASRCSTGWVTLQASDRPVQLNTTAA